MTTFGRFAERGKPNLSANLDNLHLEYSHNTIAFLPLSISFYSCNKL
jgi:hypothetical protein